MQCLIPSETGQQYTMDNPVYNHNEKYILIK